MKRERRPYEQVALVATREVRQLCLYWARRCRKSTTLGAIAFDELSQAPGRMVIAASASLLLGKELVGVTLSAAEQAMIVTNEAAAVRDVFAVGAAERGLDFQVADQAQDQVLRGLSPEDFAELYQSSRMELRLYFTRTQFSRLQVIAPNPATARSWRATVLRDEAGFTPANFEVELRNATDPMMRDTPDLKIIYASNLSSNDRHPYFETTMPREITAPTEEEQFPAQGQGHLYIGQHGLLVHRVALKDAYAAGHRLFDDRSQPMTYEQCQTFPQFRSGWDATYALNHKSGGAAAVDLVALITAQRRGAGQCAFVMVEHEGDWQRALHLLRGVLRDGPVTLGLDVASTTHETSNPTSLTVTEKLGTERFQRLVALWKTRQRVVTSARLADVTRAVRGRPAGGPPRRVLIDATSERLAAEETAADLRGQVPVQLVVASETLVPPGYNGPVNYKTYLGDLYSAAINDGQYALAPEAYLKDDHRLVTKDGGRYQCVPDADGRHGDTFDSGKLAEFGHVTRVGKAWVAPVESSFGEDAAVTP